MINTLKKRTRDEGRSGFDEYFRHVTRFRPSCAKWIMKEGGLPIIKACDVSHPNTPDIIKNKIEHSFKTYIQAAFENGQALDILKLSEHQPSQAKHAITVILQKRFKHPINKNNVLLIYGSSTQWLDMVFGKLITESLHDDFSNGPSAKKPVIIAPSGSFKCGGYFPHANGGELQYIPTTIEDNYKLNATLLEKTINRIESQDLKKVVCFVLETPSALGQNYTEEELRDLAKVLIKYRHIFWLQDTYNLGTEHDLTINPSLADCEDIATQGCTVSSFRRDWGGASAYANVSAIHSDNIEFINEISQQCSQTYFYTHPPFSDLQRYVTNLIAEEMADSKFQEANQKYFNEQFVFYRELVQSTNETLNTKFNTKKIRYIFTIEVQSGQFGFLFFDNDLMKNACITNDKELAEIMCLVPECRVMPTLLSPMGIGKNPIGVRFNICLSNQAEKNQQIIREILDRMTNLVVSIIKNKLNYSHYYKLIQRLYSEE